MRPRPKLPVDLPDDTCIRKVATTGNIMLNKVLYKVDTAHAFKHVLVVSQGEESGEKITVTDLQGEILAEHTRPAPGITYVGNNRRPGTRPQNPGMSPKS